MSVYKLFHLLTLQLFPGAANRNNFHFSIPFHSFIPSSFYCKFKNGLTRIYFYGTLESFLARTLRFVLFLHCNQFARTKKEEIIEKNSFFLESSLKFHARLSNVGGMTQNMGMRRWILTERNYIENWKITLEI